MGKALIKLLRCTGRSESLLLAYSKHKAPFLYVPAYIKKSLNLTIMRVFAATKHRDLKFWFKHILFKLFNTHDTNIRIGKKAQVLIKFLSLSFKERKVLTVKLLLVSKIQYYSLWITRFRNIFEAPFHTWRAHNAVIRHP